QIRNKLEQELSKKRNGPTTRSRTTKKIAGTVSALKPTQALTVKENILVIEASQLMAAKRSDCVLVVDDDDHLSGIFTAKDLAYRVVADGLDTRATSVADIMTKGPICVTADTSATVALNLMVSRGFRHLPVCNEEGDIFGLLDITKCLYEAMDKMERAFGSSRKLYDALEGVEREWTNGPIQLVQYMEVLRDRMSCPDLASVLDGAESVEVTVKTNVKEVAKLMKAHHTTAVLVMEHGEIAGIFTSKDIVLRVIAAGLNPDNCSVVRVMTPHPDTAPPSMNIMDALRKMHDGHYLNLPVLDDEKTVLGLVDVLKLTYATLEQINSIQGSETEGGPMWNKFWNSFTPADNAESESVVSDSHPPSVSLNHRGSSPGTPPSIMNQQQPSPYSPLGNFPEITPNESASVANDDDVKSNVSSHTGRYSRQGHLEDGIFAFKFKSLNGKVHRFTADITSFGNLREIVKNKVYPEHLSLSRNFPCSDAGFDSSNMSDVGDDEWLSISYQDDEDDRVAMTSDGDLYDSVALAKKQGLDRVMLFVSDSSIPQQLTFEPPHSAVPMQLFVTEQNVPAAQTHKGLDPVREAQEDDEIDARRLMRSSSSHHRHDAEKGNKEFIAGVPTELLLPAAIAFLGVVIIGVSIGVSMASRVSGGSRGRY
ncbi:hypothetical protein BC938DRAFT_483717, partial [Jimgerdemannia flammicorona]